MTTSSPRASLAWLPLLSVVLLGFAQTVAACHGTFAPVPAAGQSPLQQPGDDQPLRVYLKTSGANPFLSTSQDAPSDPALTVGDATGGTVDALNAVQGKNSQTSAVFILKEGLPHDYWLNLSRGPYQPGFNYGAPITGSVWVSTLGLQTASHDRLFYRVEVFSGANLIGTDECSQYLPSAAYAAWNAGPMKMRPELYKIPKGEPLTVRVTRISSLDDFRIGTGGDQASFIELRVTPYDLIETASLRDGPRVYYGAGPDELQPTGGATTERSSASSPPPAIPWALTGAGVAPLGLLVRRTGRRPGIAALLAALFVAGALAGCMGGHGSTAPTGSLTDPVPPVQTSTEYNETLRAAGIGAIAGSVRNDQGVDLPGAHVAIISTDLFATTDRKGVFRFPNVTAGVYKVRIDLSPYSPIEQLTKVEVGRLLFMNITLSRATGVPLNAQEHQHDTWNGALTKQLWSTDVVPFSYEGGAQLQPNGAWFCVYYVPCEAQVPLDATVPVPPGTLWVDVTLTWDPGVQGPQELALRATTAAYSAADGTYGLRGPGKAFHLYVSPEQSDRGHQTYTTWQLFVSLPNTHTLYDPMGVPAYGGVSKIHVEAVAHKGKVVAEPAHPRFWGNQTEIRLFEDAATAASSAANDYPYYTNSWPQPYTSISRLLIPVGTKDLTGTLRWTRTDGQNQQLGTDWTLSYRPGNVRDKTIECSGYDQTPKVKPAAMSNRKALSVDFTITPLASEVDQFYAPCSNWRFYVDDNQAALVPPYGANTAYISHFFLTLTLHKDPDYVET